MKNKKLLIAGLLGVLLLLLSATPSVAGQVQAGYVQVVSPGAASLTSAGGSISTITLTEGSAGSTIGGLNSVTLTLPSGFMWQSTPSVNASVYGPAITTNIFNNGRTLSFSVGAISAIASTITIDAMVCVDETIAQGGDVICLVSGNSNVAPGTLKVATYTTPVNVPNPNINVSAGSAPTILGGRANQYIGDLTISESAAGQLAVYGTITLTLPDGAVWNSPSIFSATSTFNGICFTPWIIGADQKTIKTVVVSASTGPAIINIARGTVDLAANFTGDLMITVSGSAGASGTVKVAQVVAPVTAALEAGSSPAQILTGVQNQPLPNIIVTENVPGAFYTGFANPVLRLGFAAGVIPTIPTVQVTAGNLIVDTASVNRGTDSAGRYYLEVRLLGLSTVASTVKFSNLRVTVEGYVPVGPMGVSVYGNSVIETALIFPGATHVARVTAGEVYLTAPVTVSGVTVSGTAQLESGYDPGVNVTLVDTSLGSSTLQAFTDASGNYQFINVQPGTYNVVATHKGFLKATVLSVSVSTSPVSVPALTMKAGDLNGDNKIDLLDVATFAKNYGSVGN